MPYAKPCLPRRKKKTDTHLLTAAHPSAIAPANRFGRGYLCRWEEDMKVYLFKRQHGRVTHAVISRHAPLGMFELDRIFGGGFIILCTGKTGSGSGVLSEVTMSTGHVTCKKCLTKIRPMGGRIASIPARECWPPKHLRELGQPRFLGIPG